MALERKDRVKDQTASTGTGTITIDLVAPTGYRTFSAHTSGATVRYLIINSLGTEWEVGQGIWSSSGSTLTRTTVFASSNSNALVPFGAGLKTVTSLPVSKDFRPAFYDNGTTNDLVYDNGEMQRWAPATGAQTLTISGWPSAGDYGILLIEGVNLGNATITWPTPINWILADGTFSTNFSNTGTVLQTAGTDFIWLFTRDGGTTVYGKVIR